MQSGDNDRAGWPSLDDLEVAWREELLERLPIGVRALLSSGRFVAVEDGSAVMDLPNEPHVRACEGFLSEVETLLESRFGVAVPVRLIADGGSIHEEPDLADPGLRGVEDWARGSFGLDLDPDQATAVSAPGRNVLVIARAGSGKTRVLTTRALWLHRVRNVSPSQLLLLAFNVRAAEEMRERLRPHFRGEMPHVMTFHSLAWSLVQPEEDLVVDDQVSGQRSQSREVLRLSRRSDRDVVSMRTVIERLGLIPKVLAEKVKLLLAPTLEDWDRIESDELDLATVDEEISRRPEVVIQGDSHTLRGTYVKSHGERLIDNTLFLSGIDARYEQPFEWGEGIYKPDFTISAGGETGVVIEYFGMLGVQRYTRQARRKRQYWEEKPGWTLVELTPDDLRRRGEEGFKTYLLETLKGLGVEFTPLTPEQILDRMPRAIAIDKHTTALTSFIARCRNQGLSLEDLLALIGGHSPWDREEREFLNYAAATYEAYLEEVIGGGHEDFNGVLWRAADKVGRRETRFIRDSGQEEGDLQQIRHVLIDEFQDFSKAFHAIVSATQAVNPKACVFAVGDDWQAINGFAGSDLKYFTNFERFFVNPTTFQLPKNYRSTTSIVGASNALMSGSGSTGPEGVAVSNRSGSTRLWVLEEFQASLAEQDDHGSDVLTAAVLRLLKEHLDGGRDVVLLSRTNEVKPGLNIYKYEQHLRSLLDRQHRPRVTVSTTHRYKGLEKDAVIILDASIRRYPLIHPDSKYQRAFGDTEMTITDAEKRLFYVALTRARSSLDILTTREDERSPFLECMADELRCASWAELPSLGEERLQVRVYKAYEVRSTLSELGYTFDPEEGEKCWWKTIPATELRNYSDITRMLWYQRPVQVRVLSNNRSIVWDSELASG